MPSTFPKPTFGRRPAAAPPKTPFATIVAQRNEPSPARYPTRVVRIVEENGAWVEKVGRPMCLWPKVNFRPVLGPDHYLAGSAAHLERLQELGNKQKTAEP